MPRRVQTRPGRAEQRLLAGEQVDAGGQCHHGVARSPRRAGDEIRRRTRRTAGQTAEPILQCRAHHLHKLFRRGRIDAERILHPDQQAADGLLIRAEPPGKGRHALHELRDDERRQQRQRTEKQRIADGHRPAAPAAKELLRKKARGYVQYIGQQQPPAKRCQQPEKRPGPAQHARQPVCRGKHRRDARRQQQPVLHRVGCAVKTVFHCRSSCFVVHCLQRILCSSYLLLLYHFFSKGKEPYDWNHNNLRKTDVFRENSRQRPPAGHFGAVGGRCPRRPGHFAAAAHIPAA